MEVGLRTALRATTSAGSAGPPSEFHTYQTAADVYQKIGFGPPWTPNFLGFSRKEPQGTPRRPKGSQRRPKGGPKGAKGGPKGAKGGPKGAKESPRAPQGILKRATRDPKAANGTKGSQGGHRKGHTGSGQVPKLPLSDLSRSLNCFHLYLRSEKKKKLSSS